MRNLLHRTLAYLFKLKKYFSPEMRFACALWCSIQDSHSIEVARGLADAISPALDTEMSMLFRYCFGVHTMICLQLINRPNKNQADNFWLVAFITTFLCTLLNYRAITYNCIPSLLRQPSVWTLPVELAFLPVSVLFLPSWNEQFVDHRHKHCLFTLKIKINYPQYNAINDIDSLGTLITKTNQFWTYIMI